MIISNAVANLERQGYQLALSGENITYRGPERLPDETLESMRKNKTELKAWITARGKLTIVSNSLGCPIDELLGFYQNDMADIARMKMETVRFLVRDYIQYRSALTC